MRVHELAKELGIENKEILDVNTPQENKNIEINETGE